MVRRVGRALRDECPPSMPVRVRLVNRSDGWIGSCAVRSRYYEIRLCFAGATIQELVDTLLHEWAHALAYGTTFRAEFDDHGPEWGVAYSRAYQATVED